jgi:hypothetical protein
MNLGSSVLLFLKNIEKISVSIKTDMNGPLKQIYQIELTNVDDLMRMRRNFVKELGDYIQPNVSSNDTDSQKEEVEDAEEEPLPNKKKGKNQRKKQNKSKPKPIPAKEKEAPKPITITKELKAKLGKTQNVVFPVIVSVVTEQGAHQEEWLLGLHVDEDTLYQVLKSRSSGGTKRFPIAGVAALVNSTLEAKDMTIKGRVFPFLPLPLETGLPMHVSVLIRKYD